MDYGLCLEMESWPFPHHVKCFTYLKGNRQTISIVACELSSGFSMLYINCVCERLPPCGPATGIFGEYLGMKAGRECGSEFSSGTQKTTVEPLPEVLLYHNLFDTVCSLIHCDLVELARFSSSNHHLGPFISFIKPILYLSQLLCKLPNRKRIISKRFS